MTSLNHKINNHKSTIARQLTPTGLFSKTKAITWLKPLIQAALLILITRQLAIITWQLVPDNSPATTHSKNIQPYTPTNKNAEPNNSLSVLNGLYLFGKPSVSQKPEPKNVPVSRLAVRITGLVASSNPKESLVIIRSGSVDTTYRPGETLRGTQATVDTIYADRVIIRNGGRYESLLMYPGEVKKRSAAAVNTQPKSKKTVAELRKKLLANPESWTEIVTISPVRKDGRLHGYRVNPARYPQQFAQLGLKPNDLAIAINGYDLTNNSEAMKIMSQLSSISQLSLTIERDGQRFEIDLSS